MYENFGNEFPTILSYLRKMIAMQVGIGSIANVDSSKPLASELNMMQLLLDVRSKEEALDFLKKFLHDNAKYIECLVRGIGEHLKENQSKAVKISFDDLDKSVIPLVPLPSKFSEFRQKYYRVKCYKCEQFPLTGRGSLCLICGKISCRFVCAKDSKKIQSCGNLNKHAKDVHCGVGLCLDTETATAFMINSPKNVVFKSIYEDQYGQKVEPLTNFNWDEYLLNQTSIEELRKELVANTIAQKICRVIDTSGSKNKGQYHVMLVESVQNILLI